MENNLQTAIQKALEGAPERNFVESLEMSFTLKDIDLKNPSNRIQEEVRPVSYTHLTLPTILLV